MVTSGYACQRYMYIYLHIILYVCNIMLSCYGNYILTKLHCGVATQLELCESSKGLSSITIPKPREIPPRARLQTVVS